MLEQQDLVSLVFSFCLFLIFFNGFSFILGLIRILKKMYLVPDGEMGLTFHNGLPVFLRPGRYVLLSFTHNFVQNISINDDLIKHGPITIVTVKKVSTII